MPSKQIPPGWGENRGKLPPGWKREETKLYEEAVPEEPSAAVPVPEEPERIADAQTPAPAPAVPEPVEEEPPKPEEPKPVEPEPEELEPAESEPAESEPEESEPEEPEPEEPKLVEPTPEEPEPEEPEPEKPHPEQPKKAPRSPRKKRPVWVWGLCGAAVVCLGVFAGLPLIGGHADKPVLPTDGAIAENMQTPTLTPGTEPTTVPTVEPTPEESDEPVMPVEPSTEPSAAPDSEGTPTAESSIPPINSTSEPPIASPTDSGENISTLEQAVKKARSRLNGEYGYSQNSLIKHLEEYDGFTHEEAVYGVDHSGVDWKEQAVKRAQYYLLEREDSLSLGNKDHIIGQLEYNGFTHEEAVYGVEHSGADWNEQVVKTAKYYLYDSEDGISYDKLLEYLVDLWGFTGEEVAYVTDHCDDVDWREQAQRKAEYLWQGTRRGVGYGIGSRDDMISYLENYELFTHEEAVYGADHCSADWNQ